MKAGAQIAEIFSNPSQYPIITGQEDATILRYSGTRPNISPFYDWRPLEFNGNRRATAFLANTLEELNDPRLGRYPSPNTNGVFFGDTQRVGSESAYEFGDLQQRDA